MGHVFISYSRKDGDFVELLRKQLIEHQFEVWTDSIARPGFDWRQEIDEAIRKAFALLVVVTAESKKSEYVTYEWAFALGLGVRVIPIILEESPLHPRLEYLQHINFAQRTGDTFSWDQLMSGLENIRDNAGKDTLMSPSVAISQLRTSRMNTPGAWLTLRQGPQPGQTWNLNEADLTIGRDVSNHIVVNDQEVSRRHARLTRDKDGNFMLEDLGSSNGSFINEKEMKKPTLLKSGDVIRLGETVIMIYQITGLESH